MGITDALLDTHAFLWAIFEPKRLSRRVARWLTDPAVVLHLSVASIWEIEFKHRKGKLQAEASVVDRHMAALFIAPMAITVAHVRALEALGSTGHKDPFDRLIVAQALVDGMSVVSADPKLDAYGISRLW